MGCYYSTPLVFEFVREGQVVKLEDHVRKEKPNLAVRDRSSGDSLLHHAVLTETAAHTFMTEYLINKQGLDVDAQNKNGQAPLHIAAKMGKPAHIRVLLQYGAMPSTQDKSGKIALHYAAVQEKVNNVLIFGQSYDRRNKSKLKVDACLEMKDKDGNTPFHLSVITGCFENTRALLKLKAYVEPRNLVGKTPLMLACEKGDHAIVKMLLLMEVDIEIQDNNGRRALFFACNELDSPDHQRCAIELDNTAKKKEAKLKDAQKEGGARLSQLESMTDERSSYVAASGRRSTAARQTTVQPVCRNPNAIPGAKLQIEFKTQDDYATITFTNVPLGMGFESHMPLVVSKLIPGAAAEELGVEVGWEFVAIAGEKLEGKSKEECLQMLSKGAKNLEETPSAVFEFGVHDPASSRGAAAKYLSRKKVAFMKMPLGFDYSQSLPMVVTDVTKGSTAESFGIEPGMHVTGIGLQSIMGKDNFFQVLDAFKSEIMKIKNQGSALEKARANAIAVQTHTV